VNLFADSGTRALMSGSTISGNSVTAISPTGTVTVQGAGLANNGPLNLGHVTISRNRATARGRHGWIRGAGVFNGLVFPTPTPKLAATASTLTGNSVIAGTGVTVQGAGLYTDSFPVKLGASRITGNTPDRCFGC
jgi:hypothetical protein